MEWARAKSIIIALFIVLNVFLLSRILMEFGSQGISREAIANMETILKSRGIVVECEIPLYDSDTPRMEYGNGILDTAALLERLLGLRPDISIGSEAGGEGNAYENGPKKLTVTGPNSFTYTDEKPEEHANITDLEECEKYLKKFLKEKKLDKTSYVPDGMPERQEDGVVFTYLEKYRGFLVYDNALKAVVSEKGVTYLEVSSREITRLSAEAIRDISTAYQVLLQNFDGSEKTVITSIDLGYKDFASLEENRLEFSEQLPVWRIKVNGVDRFFGASDGKEIQ